MADETPAAEPHDVVDVASQPVKPPYRPSTYTLDIGLQICELICDGKSLRQIFNDDTTLPSKSTFMRWLAIHPELRQCYEQALEFRSECYADDIIELVDDWSKCYQKMILTDGTVMPIEIIDKNAIPLFEARIRERKTRMARDHRKKYGVIPIADADPVPAAAQGAGNGDTARLINPESRPPLPKLIEHDPLYPSLLAYGKPAEAAKLVGDSKK